MIDKNKETGCCPRFNPQSWDEKIINWKDKKFVEAKRFYDNVI